jgi:hypothetical protein
VPGLVAEDELPWLSAVAEELLDGWLLMEAWVFVSVPVWLVEVLPAVAVLVPGVFACVPAVEPVPETELDCVVPVPVSFDEVLVFSLLLLQPKTNAVASARPYAYFMCCLLKGFHGAFNWGRRPKNAGKSPAASQR